MRAGVVAVAAAALLLAGCTSAPDSAEPAGPTSVTFGLDRAPYSMDPYRAALGGAFMAYLDPVYDTLIRMEDDGSFTPGLATEWEYLDTRSFRMVLREGVTFHDEAGTPFDAVAVQANLDRLLTMTGPMTGELKPMYGSTEIVGEHEVIVHLTAANPDLERIFSQVLGMMVNPVALAENPDAVALAPQGAGPYVLDESRTVVDDTYVYEKIDGYWDDAAFPFDTLTLKVFVDRNAMLSALQSGVADVGYGAPDTLAAAENFGLSVATRPVNVMVVNFMDRDRPESPLSDPLVRRAISVAIDRESILQTVYSGQGVVTNQLFHEGPGTGFDADLENAFPYDPDLARELLAEAGVPDGFTFTSAIPVATRDTVLAEAIASNLAEVGITMEIVPLPPGAFGAEAWRPYHSITGSFASQGAFADTQLVGIPSGSGWNAHNSEDATITALWEAGAEAENVEERQERFAELSAEFQEQAWFAPIIRLNAIALYDAATVGGVELPPGISTPRIRGWVVPAG